MDYLPSSVTGFCTITATDSTGASATLVVDQTAPSPEITTAPTVVLTADPTTLQAVSTATSSLSATVTAGKGNTNTSDDVMFFSSGGPACGTISPSAVELSAASGTVSSTYTANSVPGSCQLYAIESANGQVSQMSSATSTSPDSLITQSSAVYSISATANPTSLAAGSGATSTVTVTLTNNGAPVSGVEVTLECAGGNACSNYDSGQYPNSNGEAVFTYTVGDTVGFATLTAAEETDSSINTNVLIAQTES